MVYATYTDKVIETNKELRTKMKKGKCREAVSKLLKNKKVSVQIDPSGKIITTIEVE